MSEGGTGSATERHLSLQRRRLLLIAVSAVLLLISFTFDLSIGPGNYALSEVFAAFVRSASASEEVALVVNEIRLPIAIMALLVGTMLAISGAAMQTILRNPLAEPFTLGISAAAGFGASLAIVHGWSVLPGGGIWSITVNSFVFSFLTSLVLYGVLKKRGSDAQTMILVGIALLFTFNALTALLQYGASETQTQQIVFWAFGSLGRANWEKIQIAAVACALVLPFVFSQANKLTLLQLGDERAASMGVNLESLRLQMLLCASLLAALSVSFVGAIGFIGLVGPHIARMLIGEHQKYFLPMAALCGALLLSLTSIISKSIHPGIVYPIGVVTSLIGVPFFLMLALGRREAR